MVMIAIRGVKNTILVSVLTLFSLLTPSILIAQDSHSEDIGNVTSQENVHEEHKNNEVVKEQSNPEH